MPIETFRNYYNSAYRLHARRRLGKAAAGPGGGGQGAEERVRQEAAGSEIDAEEAECLLANMIYKVSLPSSTLSSPRLERVFAPPRSRSCVQQNAD